MKSRPIEREGESPAGHVPSAFSGSPAGASDAPAAAIRSAGSFLYFFIFHWS